MITPLARRGAVAVALLACLWTGPVRADESAGEVARQVNSKMVKLFGAGGFRGLVAYGSGVIVHPDGWILTIDTPMLNSHDLRVHLSDGRRYHAKVIVVEPQLDIALVKIDTKEKDLELPFFDLAAEAKKPMVDAGTSVLAFSNQFEIATRDEPMSVQQGTVSAIAKLQGRRGVHAATFRGKVYVLDAITNNPGAAGGVLTTSNGQLLGLIGKELRNELTNTWINYAIPIQTAETIIEEGDKKRTVSIVEVVEKKDKYIVIKRDKNANKADNYHGITLVANVVELTPPYVEEVETGSPAAKAGLQPDDLIVYVQGEQAGSINDLETIFSRIRPGETVKLEVRRGDKLTTLTMVMAKPLVVKKPKKPVKIDKE